MQSSKAFEISLPIEPEFLSLSLSLFLSLSLSRSLFCDGCVRHCMSLSLDLNSTRSTNLELLKRCRAFQGTQRAWFWTVSWFVAQTHKPKQHQQHNLSNFATHHGRLPQRFEMKIAEIKDTQHHTTQKVRSVLQPIGGSIVCSSARVAACVDETFRFTQLDETANPFARL